MLLLLVLQVASSFDSPLARGFDRLRARYLPFVRGDSASAEAAKGLSDRPLETFGFPLIGWYRDQALAGRGGSVSRRDHNRSTGTRVRSQAEPSQQKHTTPNASRSSGEGGWGRGASLREAASPPESSYTLHTAFPGGGPGEGPFAERPPPPDTPYLFSNITAVISSGSSGGVKAGRART